MPKVFSVILKVIAAFFFYMISVLAFVSGLPTSTKPGILIGCSVFAVMILSSGLALTRFRNWRRDTGIVLLSASGFTAFLVFTFACFLMSEEATRMMGPNTLPFFSDYLTGGGVIVGLALLGWMLVKTDKNRGEQGTELIEESTANHTHQ